ncbi:unnamed protein product [Amoebophrya sp. A120]|nr:unnamed protein product [Amoebophrya sp. A120]|eukprot:GSA120T00012774001.1
MDRFTLTVLLCVFNGVASVTMMMGNKKLALVFPFPFTTILLQNAVCFLICALLIRIQDGQSLYKKLRSMRWAHFRSCLAVGVATSLVLSTSIVALRFASVPLVVAFRNLTPIVVALLDSLVLGATFHNSAKLGLVCGLGGSLLYTVFDPPTAAHAVQNTTTGDYENKALVTSSNNTTKTTTAEQAANTSTSTLTATNSVLFQANFGLFFVIANLLLSALVNILESTTMRKLAAEQSASTVNCIRITVMQPMLLALSTVFEDQQHALHLLRADGIAVLDRVQGTMNSGSTTMGPAGEITSTAPMLFILPLFLLTGAFAALFGVSALALSGLRVSPTTLAFLNVVYKLATTVVGHFLFPANVPMLSWCGYALTFCGFLFYALGRPKKDGEKKIEKILDKKRN